ncbi:MAG: DUF1552 domain-containing protein [Deltaproteobacteria bacterium]|nr:DUF1552 domain-containing protein [Deltaproteobacteria bacterium]
MSRHILDRRTVLRGAGGIAIALPFLDAMAPSRKAYAATLDPMHAVGGFPRRFVLFFSANGTVAKDWLPDSSFKMGPILSPLEAHKNELLLLQGVHGLSGNSGPGDNPHDVAMGHLLTCTDLVVGPGGTGANGHLVDGSAGGPSIDQEIAKTIGTTTKFRSLEFGVVSLPVAVLHMAAAMCYEGSFKRLPPESDPAAMFRRVFGELTTANDPTADAARQAADVLRAQRKSVLDLVLPDYQTLSQRLGAADRRKIEAHLDSLRGIERQLQPGGDPKGSMPNACKKPNTPPTIDFRSAKNYEAVGKLQMDLLTMALACDLTRVASLQWSFAESYLTFPWLNIAEQHHDISHAGDSDATARANLVKINTWYAQQFAGLIERLKAVPEGDGNLFDHTTVVWVNELGKGNIHSRDNYPWVVASGAGGKMFRTGRLFTAKNVPHNNLFVTFQHAMGIMAATKFGNPKYSTGNLDSDLLGS